MNIARVRSMVRTWLGRKPRPWVIVGAFAVIGGGVLAYAITRDRAPRGGSGAPVPAEVAPRAATIPSWLDGAPLPEGAPQPFAVAVVVDNAPEALPQSGITDAPVVFEVPVEGGRTRFLTLFPLDADVREVGPVRSARPYLVGLAKAIGVPLVHVGGSDAALRMLRGQNHVNQYYDPPFRRATFRRAPFNVYTSVGDLAAFVREKGWLGVGESAVKAVPLFPFSDTSPEPEGKPADGSVVRLPFGDPAYVVEWGYDAARGVYVRSQGGRPHRDANGKPVEAANVVVLRVRARVLDAIGRLRISVLEESFPEPEPGVPSAGSAIVFSRGHRTDGEWIPTGGGAPGSVRFNLLQRERDREGTVFLVSIAVRPGTTWAEFINFDLEP